MRAGSRSSWPDEVRLGAQRQQRATGRPRISDRTSCAGQHLVAFPVDLPLATRQLIISNNRIAELPPLALNYLSDLVYLDCSNNSLTEVSESTFGNLRKLAYLDLSFNTLRRIEDRTFGPLASLVMLRMTDNPGLSDIHPDAFSENEALQVLDVSRNNLTALNITSLLALAALRSVGLGGNPWSCQCDNEDLCLWVHLETFKFQGPVGSLSLSPRCHVRKRLSSGSGCRTLQLELIRKPGYSKHIIGKLSGRKISSSCGFDRKHDGLIIQKRRIDPFSTRLLGLDAAAPLTEQEASGNFNTMAVIQFPRSLNHPHSPYHSEPLLLTRRVANRTANTATAGDVPVFPPLVTVCLA
ncbi:hypothetical protein CCH79_00011303 [Gambusia affinis]|uniref:LRRCT domain-containing protein n=1 Tax=Gambusia affinis TaxID=33528 RepID=A0A315VEP4_GAMAF|nr:hypothetical protein CCH79_00011303 [Gambusia affinis]